MSVKWDGLFLLLLRLPLFVLWFILIFRVLLKNLFTQFVCAIAS